VHGVKHLQLVLLLVVIVLFSGCVGWDRSTYYRVRVTDPRGVLIADWVAEGWVQRIEGGYRFRAVQRLSGGPWAKLIRYPQGITVEASGPNILISRCDPPVWLHPGYVEHTRVVDRSKD
jgi:hypothetical protein